MTFFSKKFNLGTSMLAVVGFMNPYSLDLRTRVAAACQEPGANKTAVARRFGVSRSFVKGLVRQQRETGSLASKPASGGRARYLDAAAQA